VSRYLSDDVFPHQRSDSITVRQLLTHAAGLGDVVVGASFRKSPSALTHFDQVLALVRDDPPAGAPRVFRYGNDDYILLGAIIERVSRQSFADYMRNEVFQKAGMRNTGYVLVPRPANLAHGYTSRNLGVPAYTRPGDPSDRVALQTNDTILPGVGIPGAVAYTTADDLMHFADALRSRRFLDSSAVKVLWTGQIATGQGEQNPANREYGFGFFVGNSGPNRIVNHGGTGPGIDVGFDIYPDLGYVVVVLSNLDPPAAQDIRQLLRETFAKF